MRGIFEYIPLNDNKIPIGKPSEGGFPFNEVKDFSNVGVLVPEPYIVLDFDTKDDAKIMLNIVDELDLKCNVLEYNVAKLQKRYPDGFSCEKSINREE